MLPTKIFIGLQFQETKTLLINPYLKERKKIAAVLITIC